MKKKIVYTDKYALILSDEEIKEGDLVFGGLGGVDIKQYGKYFAEDWIKIIAHLPLSDAPILEGVPLLPSFSWGQQDDVDFHFGELRNVDIDSFYAGYNKAKEKYKYTEEDVRRAIEMGTEIKGDGMDDMFFTDDEIIKRLQQPSRPTHFECEMVRTPSQIFYTYDVPYHSPKTITNSQGQIELVGKYLNS